MLRVIVSIAAIVILIMSIGIATATAPVSSNEKSIAYSPQTTFPPAPTKEPMIYPVPPPKISESYAYIVAKINDEGSAALLYTFELVNKKNESLREVKLLIPYDSSAMKIYYARQQRYESFGYEVYVDARGKIYNATKFEEARANAGKANSSGIDAEEKAVHGLVYAEIKYPSNATKFELVDARQFKKLAIDYNGWENVPMNLQQSFAISARKETRSEKRYMDKEVPYEPEEKDGRLWLKLLLPSEVKPEESTKLTVKYKVNDKVTISDFREMKFSIKFALPQNVIDATVTIMPPKHEIFGFTKPDYELREIKVPVPAQRDVRTYALSSTSAPMAPGALAEKVQEQSKIEEKMLSESGSYFLAGRSYRLMLYDVTPEEPFEIAGWYSSKVKYRGIPLTLGTVLGIVILAAGWRKIKAFVW